MAGEKMENKIKLWTIYFSLCVVWLLVCGRFTLPQLAVILVPAVWVARFQHKAMRPAGKPSPLNKYQINRFVESAAIGMLFTIAAVGFWRHVVYTREQSTPMAYIFFLGPIWFYATIISAALPHMREAKGEKKS